MKTILISAVAVAFALALTAGGGLRASESTPARSPNIIYILADDLGYGDVGSYGQTRIATPHIDALAAQGMRFTQFYAGSTVCTPSRSVLMEGKHNGHTVARDNVPHYETYLRDDDVTVAEVLQMAGYRTGGVGKWSLGNAGSEGRATRQGFDRWFGYLNQDHAHYYYTEYLDDDEGRMVFPGNSRTQQHYSHDLLTDQALTFIDASADGPFFLYAAYTLPHYSSKDEDPTELAVPCTGRYADEPWSPAAKNYAAMVTRLDRDVGRLVARVEELGLTENTLIIFTSDNGPWGPIAAEFASSGPLRGVKRDLYEGGIRVPFIARWPGVIPAATVNDRVAAAWDIMPTLAELAGVKAPADTDGISLVSALRGADTAPTHDYLYFDFGHTRAVYHQAVRIGDWKGVRHGVGGPIELYDLATDLGESRDVAEAHPGVVARIDTVMAEAVVPNPYYRVGDIYTGSPIWTKETHWPAPAGTTN